MAQWPEKGTGIRLPLNGNLDSFYIYNSCPLPIYHRKNILLCSRTTQEVLITSTRISFNQCVPLYMYFRDTQVFCFLVVGFFFKLLLVQGLLTLCFSCSSHFSLFGSLFPYLRVNELLISLEPFKSLTVYNCSRLTVLFPVKTGDA